MSLDQYTDRLERQAPTHIPFANAPYKGKQKGDTISFVPVKSLIQPYRSLRRPVFGEGGKETTALQNISGWVVSQRGDNDLDSNNGLLKWEDCPRPPAEQGMLELYNIALREYRNYLMEMKIKDGTGKNDAIKAVNKIQFKINMMGYWSLDSQVYGVIALMGNDIVPFALKASSYDPLSVLGFRYKDTPQQRMSKLMDGEFSPKTVAEVVGVARQLFGEDAHDYAKLAKAKNAEDALASMSVNDAITVLEYFNRGVKQIFEETHEVSGRKYYKYPKGLTRITLLAGDSKRLMFGKPYIIWTPSAFVHEDYQTMIPAEYGDYLFIHPEDVDAVRAYLNLPKEARRKTATPRIRECPDIEGNLVYLSFDNPDLQPIKVNLLSGPAAEIYSQAIIGKWMAFPEYHAFKASNQTSLVGGVYFDVPVVEYEIESRIEKNEVKVKAMSDPKRVYPSLKTIAEAEIFINPKDEPVIWYNLDDGTLAKNKSGRNKLGGPAILKWTNGLLWDRPLNLGRMDQNMNVVLGSREVIAKIEAHADKLGVPYRGKTPPPLYAWFVEHPLHEKFVEYHRGSTKVVDTDTSDDDTLEEVPADKHGARIVV